MARPWRWTRKRAEAAELLAEGCTQSQVASAVGISPRTVRLWLGRPEFDARLRELEAEARDNATRALRRKGVAAAERLISLMNSGITGDHVKLKAATEILDRIGVVTVSKIAPVDPTGENPYVGLSDDELRAAIGAEYQRLQEAGATADSGEVPLDPEGAAKPDRPAG